MLNYINYYTMKSKSNLLQVRKSYNLRLNKTMNTIAFFGLEMKLKYLKS